MLAYFTTELNCLFIWRKPKKINSNKVKLNSNELQLKEKNQIFKAELNWEGVEFHEEEILSDQGDSETILSDPTDQSLNELLKRIADQTNSLKLLWKKNKTLKNY